MKKIFNVFIIGLIAASLFGCGGQPVSEAEFKAVWQLYLSREFEEGFDEKQSSVQKEKILRDSVSRAGLDYDEFVKYLKKNHSDKYSRIF